jgi:hypothetical protein
VSVTCLDRKKQWYLICDLIPCEDGEDKRMGLRSTRDSALLAGLS